MKTKILKTTIILCIISLIFANLSTVCADDVDEEDENIEILQENTENAINEVSNNKKEVPILNSRRCIVYDRNSKTIIYGKNENVKCAMASTTKIMTATIVLENANLDDEVTVSAKAGGTGGSRLGLKKRRQNNVK